MKRYETTNTGATSSDATARSYERATLRSACAERSDARGVTHPQNKQLLSRRGIAGLKKKASINALAVLALLSIVLLVTGAIFLGNSDITGFAVSEPVDDMGIGNESNNITTTQPTEEQSEMVAPPTFSPEDNLSEEVVIVDETIEETNETEIVEEPEEIIDEIAIEEEFTEDITSDITTTQPTEEQTEMPAPPTLSEQEEEKKEEEIVRVQEDKEEEPERFGGMGDIVDGDTYSAQDDCADGFTCGCLIDSPGEYTLGADITDCTTGNIIDVRSSNVILDCDERTLRGDTATNIDSGIVVRAWYGPTENITIKNCVIEDITSTNPAKGRGILLVSAHTSVDSWYLSNVTVTNNTIDNVEIGIMIKSEVINAAGTSNVKKSYIYGNDIQDTVDSSIWLYASTYGTATGAATIIEDNKIWLNNINYAVNVTEDNSAGGTAIVQNNEDCKYDCDSRQCNYFGNYYGPDGNGIDPWPTIAEVSCPSSNNNYRYLPEEVDVPLNDFPVFCGATLIDDYIFGSSNLKNPNPFEGDVCDSWGLIINESGVDLDCNNKWLHSTTDQYVDGIRITGSHMKEDITITDCKIDGFEDGLSAQYANNLLIDNVNINDTRKGGTNSDCMYFTDVGNLTIQNSDLINCTYRGVYLGTGGDTIIDAVNIYDSGNNSIDVGNANNGMTITDVEISGTRAGRGISSESDRLDVSSTIISNIEDITKSAIYLKDSSNSTIGPEVTIDDAEVGLYLDGDSDYITFTDNTINNVVHGIFVFSSTTDNGTFSDNIINASTGAFSPGISADHNLSGNSFYSGNVPDTGLNNFCVNGVGNFYAEGIAIPDSECDRNFTNPQGWPDYETCENHFDDPDCVYDVEGGPVSVSWLPTSGAEPIIYEVGWAENGTNGPFYYAPISDQNTSSTTKTWTIDALTEGHYYNLTVTPIANSGFLGEFVRGEKISSGLFSLIDMDDDDDGYNSDIYGGDDCDDDNALINPGVTEQCGTAYDRHIDFNCDNYPGWGDPTCLASFTAAGSDFIPGVKGTTDWNNYNYDTVYDFTLNNSYGRVKYHNPINLENINLADVLIANNLVSIASSITNLNKPAEIWLYGQEYQYTPNIYRNGVTCSDGICSDINYNETTYTVMFNVTGFSNYTTGTNANLLIYDESDPEGGSNTLETYHEIRMFANYSNATLNTPINNYTDGGLTTKHRGTCNITLYFEDNTPLVTNAPMGFNEYLGRYSYAASPDNFTYEGTYYYNITCDAPRFEELTGHDSFIVIEDETPPVIPTLYPQILLHPTNTTTEDTTLVYGYVGEPFINVTVTVRNGAHYYEYNITSEYSAGDSVQGGSSLTISDTTLVGQNQTFINWSPSTESLLNSFKYIEFLNHNRTAFLRYGIDSSVQLGEEILIEFNETLEHDIPIGTHVAFHDNYKPAGWFNRTVDLRGGSNKIQAWGRDLETNEGLSAIDYINYPYGEGLPPAPLLWALPEATKDSLDIVGLFPRDVWLENNLSIVSRNDSNVSFDSHTDSIFSNTGLLATAMVSQDAPENNHYVFINGSDAQLFANKSLYVGFANHNRSYWLYYEILGNSSPVPGEDLRIYLGPNLTTTTLKGTVISLYNESTPNGWFNVTYDESNLFLNKSNEIYGVLRDNNGEGPPSDSQYVFYDETDPEFITNHVNHDDWRYWNTLPTEKIYRLRDNHKINLTAHAISWDDGTNRTWFVTDETWVMYDDDEAISEYIESWLSEDLENDSISTTHLSCSGPIINETCTASFNMSADTYTIKIYVRDAAGNQNITTLSNVIVEEGGLFIENLTDTTDITNWPELNATWDLDGDVSKWSHYQVSIGTEQYPTTNYNNTMDWFNVSTDSMFVNKSNMTFMTSTVYYINVRAISIADTIGPVSSTNGILFIDSTAPECANGRCVLDEGLWTNADDRLQIEFNFTDEESDVIEYEYAIGTACYPNSGYNTVLGRTQTDDNQFTKTGLVLSDGNTYSISAKARNGNEAESFEGPWSPWYCSDNITVDVSNPYDGWVSYDGGNITDDQLLITYTSGWDTLSGIESTNLMVETTSLAPGSDNTCEEFTGDYSVVMDLPVIPGNTTGSRIYNLTDGTCYSFNILVYDRAGNSDQFGPVNGSIISAVDSSPPSTIVSVTDDGFYTYTPDQLDAEWSDSTDSETGVPYYQVIVRGKHWDDDTCDATNCTPILLTSTTDTEMTVSGFESTHNWKYYFEVIPFNGFDDAGESTYSDGIIYVDILPPDPITITSVNNDTTNYYETGNATININFTGEPNLYCVLSDDDVDFDESYQRCYEQSSGEYTCTNTSENKLTDYGLTSSDGQGLFTWSITCKDENGNAQNSDTNKEVQFFVDWPDKPIVEDLIIYSETLEWDNQDLVPESQKNYWMTSEVDGSTVYYNLTAMNVNVTGGTVDILAEYGGTEEWFNNSHIGSLITFDIGSVTIAVSIAGITEIVDLTFYDNEIFIDDISNVKCLAEVYDQDTRFDIQEVNMSLMIEHIDADQYPNDGFTAVDDYHQLYEGDLTIHSTAARERIINCTIDVDDGLHENVSNTTSNAILNTQPVIQASDLTYPVGGVISDAPYFTWFESVDSDGDKLTYTIQIDNESSPDFDPSEYSAPVTYGDINTSLDITPEFPDIYDDLVVYHDNRPSSYNIFLYNRTSDVETQLTITGSIQERYPEIYGDYVIYYSGTDLKLYKISTAVETHIEDIGSSMLEGKFYGIWDGKVAYSTQTGSSVYIYDIASENTFEIPGTFASQSRVAIYGHKVAISEGSDVYLYDMISNKTELFKSGSYGEVELYGEYVVLEDVGTGIIVYNLSDGSNIDNIANAVRPSIYGDMIVAYDSVSDLSDFMLLPGGQTVSHDYDEENPEVFKNWFAMDTASTYAHMRLFTTRLPATFSGYDTDSVRIHTANSQDYVDSDPDAGTYYWRLKVCDSTVSANSCSYSDVQSFILDNTAPEIVVNSPIEGVVTNGVVNLLTTITDNYYSQSDISANYSVIYTNNTVFKGYTDLEPNGFDSTIDFTGLPNGTTVDFRVIIEAWDPQGNKANYTLNITVNPDLPTFDFGQFNNEDEVVNETISNTFNAYDVLNSSLRISGPSTSPIQRYYGAKSNITVTDHEYDLLLSTTSWPEGIYYASMGGYNLLGFNSNDSKTFFVDRSDPVHNISKTIDRNTGMINTTFLANDTIYFETEYNDTSLEYLMIEYQDSEGNWTNKNETIDAAFWPDGHQILNTYSDGVFLLNHINTTYCWNSTAIDALGRSTEDEHCVEVNSTPPYMTDTITISDWNEDLNASSTNSNLNLSMYFSDVDAPMKDNITFTCTNSSNVTLVLNPTTGIFNLVPDSNWYGTQNITCTAADLYGESITSDEINLTVISRNDRPEILTIPSGTFDCDEDNTCVFSLSSYEYDNDSYDGASNLTWSLTDDGDNSLAAITVNATSEEITVRGKSNQNGVTNITLKLTDSQGASTSKVVEVEIISVNDVPVAGNITDPVAGEFEDQNVRITWQQAYDVENDPINYNISYSINGGAWTPTGVSTNLTSVIWSASIMEENVSLMLIADDGENTSTSFMTGNFTIDGVKPGFTSIYPADGMTVTSTGQLITVITNELADCRIYVNDTASVAPDNTTTSTTTHQALVNIEGNITYALDVICEDLAGNVNTSATTFIRRDSEITFEGYTVTPEVAWQGQPVNITLQFASIGEIDDLNIQILNSSGLPELALDEYDFLPVVNETNQYTTNITSYTDLGNHSIYIFDVDCDTCSAVSWTPQTHSDAFSIFEIANQSINLNE